MPGIKRRYMWRKVIGEFSPIEIEIHLAGKIRKPAAVKRQASFFKKLSRDDCEIYSCDNVVCK
jgi:hypothetical protein